MFQNYFDRVYLINLPERTDRKRDCEWEFRKAGFDWAGGQVEVFPAIKPNEDGGFVNRGYHGCFLSHLEIWKIARRKNCRRILVCEDDIQFSQVFAKQIEKALAELSTIDWRLAYFGQRSVAMEDRLIEWVPAKDTTVCTHCYALDRSAFDELIDFFETALTRPAGHPDGGPMSPDGALEFYRMRHPEFKAYICEPNLAVQRSSRSDLCPRWFDKVPALKQASSAMRRAKLWLAGSLE